MSVVQPMYRIFRNGKQLDAWMYKIITKVSFKEGKSEGANDSLTIELSDPEFQIMDGGYFVEKKTKLKVEMGYVDGSDFGGIFSGRVEEVTNDYPRSGMVSLKITAHGTSYRMSETEHSKTWKGKTYSDIVKAIFKKYGITCIVNSTASICPRKKNGKLTHIVQSSMSDLDFIKACANKCHYTLKVDDLLNKAWFVKDKSKINKSTVIATVDYKEGNEALRAFRPKFNDYKKAMNVNASNINIGKGKTVTTKKKKKSSKKKKKKSKKIKRFGGRQMTINQLQKFNANESGRTIYEVQSGDTLFSIAQYFYHDGNRFMEIYETNKNNIKNPDLIYMGQMLVIP